MRSPVALRSVVFDGETWIFHGSTGSQSECWVMRDLQDRKIQAKKSQKIGIRISMNSDQQFRLTASSRTLFEVKDSTKTQRVIRTALNAFSERYSGINE